MIIFNTKILTTSKKYIGNGNFSIDKSKHEQFTEISNIGFFKYEDVINKLRDYDLEKKKLISKY